MANYNKEVWKSVVGYEGIYEISSLGVVRSLDRKTVRSDGKPMTYRGKVKSQIKDKYGYNYVSLYLDNKHKQGMIHRLVATAFIPNPDNKPQVNHKDGIKTNNNIDNLEWATPQENLTHAKESGLLEGVSGEGHYKAKMTEKKVKEIRERAENGMKYQDLADEYGVVKSTIGFIVNRQTWEHVE